MQSIPIHWNGLDSSGIQLFALQTFHGTPIDTIARRGNDGPGKGTDESRGALSLQFR